MSNIFHTIWLQKPRCIKKIYTVISIFCVTLNLALFCLKKFDTFRVGPQLKKEKNYLRRLFECEQIQISLYLQNKPKILFWWRNFNKQYNVPMLKLKKIFKTIRNSWNNNG